MDFENFSPEEQWAKVRELAKMLQVQRWERLQAVIQNRTRYVTVVLEDIYSPHNGAAVLRTAEAQGIQDLHILENKNPFRYKDSTVACGAEKWLSIYKYKEKTPQANIERCYKHLRTHGYHIAATGFGESTIPLEDLSIQTPLAIVIGSEAEGLSQYAIEAADSCVTLPMHGFVQSYNLSVCAALILHTLMQKVRSSALPWQLDEHAQRAILYAWVKKSLNL